MKALAALLLLLLPLAAAGPALAHRIELFAYADSGRIFVEARYPDGRSVAGARVLVYDGSDRLLLEGRTDPEGSFSFPRPGEGDLRIVLEAAMGHRRDLRLEREADR